MSKNATIETIQKERIEGFEKDLKALKAFYRLEPIPTIEFPQYKILPDEVSLALKILERHEYKIMLSYIRE